MKETSPGSLLEKPQPTRTGILVSQTTLRRLITLITCSRIVSERGMMLRMTQQRFLPCVSTQCKNLESKCFWVMLNFDFLRNVKIPDLNVFVFVCLTLISTLIFVLKQYTNFPFLRFNKK
jgi:hypothetical protein